MKKSKVKVPKVTASGAMYWNVRDIIFNEEKGDLPFGHCKCQKPGEPQHICPWRSELYNDNEKKCNCCDDCRKACAEDV